MDDVPVGHANPLAGVQDSSPLAGVARVDHSSPLEGVGVDHPSPLGGAWRVDHSSPLLSMAGMDHPSPLVRIAIAKIDHPFPLGGLTRVDDYSPLAWVDWRLDQ